MKKNIRNILLSIVLCTLMFATVLPVAEAINNITARIVEKTNDNLRKILYAGDTGLRNYVKMKDAIDKGITNEEIVINQNESNSSFSQLVQKNGRFLIGRITKATVTKSRFDEFGIYRIIIITFKIKIALIIDRFNNIELLINKEFRISFVRGPGDLFTIPRGIIGRNFVFCQLPTYDPYNLIILIGDRS